MTVRKAKARNARTPQQPPPPTPPLVQPDPAHADPSARAARTPDRRRRAARLAEQVRRQDEECAKLAALPVQHPHAAGNALADKPPVATGALAAVGSARG
jgi:hypothetical protein